MGSRSLKEDRRSQSEREVNNKAAYKVDQYTKEPSSSDLWPKHPYSGKKATVAEKLDQDIKDYKEKKDYAQTDRGRRWPLPPASEKEKQDMTDDHANAVVEKEYYEMAQRAKKRKQ